MHRYLILAGIGASAFPAFVMAAPIVSTGTLLPGNEIFADAGGGGYNNASSITPNTTNDLLLNVLALQTNYVGNNEANGGTTVPFTDGVTHTDPTNMSEKTSAANALFDLGAGAQPWYVEYKLATPSDINSVTLISGHQDGRLNQVYDVLVSSDGTNFYSLSDNTLHALPSSASGAGDPGAGFNYSPSNGDGGAASSTITPSSGSVLASGVNYVEFVDKSGGNDIYRELVVTGTATTPEPASLSVLAIGALGLLRRSGRR